MMNKVLYEKTKKKERFKYIMIYCLLYLSGGYYMLSISGTVLLAMELAVVGIGLLYKYLFDELSFDKEALIGFLLVISIIVSGDFIRGEYVKQAVISMLNFSVAYFAALCFSFDEYIKKFVKVMYFICICSLVVYFTYLIAPGIIERLPKIVNRRGAVAYNALVSVIFGKTNTGLRNMGFFWEPGAFQTFVNLALIFELFCAKKIRTKYIIVFIISLFTTFSTTGYIVAAITATIYILHNISSNRISNSKKAKSIGLIILLIVVFVVVFANFGTNYADRVFGKLDFYMEEGTGNFEKTSTSVRVDAIFKPLEQFFENPIFGIGTTGSFIFAYEQGYNMNTCTFVNWFVYYGFFVGVFFVAMFYKMGRCLSGNKFIGALMLVAFFLLTVSENFVTNPTINIFVFLICAWDVNRKIEY